MTRIPPTAGTWITNLTRRRRPRWKHESFVGLVQNNRITWFIPRFAWQLLHSPVLPHIWFDDDSVCVPLLKKWYRCVVWWHTSSIADYRITGMILVVLALMTHDSGFMMHVMIVQLPIYSFSPWSLLLMPVHRATVSCEEELENEAKNRIAQI